MSEPAVPETQQASAKVATNFKWASLSIGLAIVVALVTWGLLQARHPFFTVPGEYDIGMSAPIEARLALMAQQARVDRLNAAVALAMGGALLTAVVSYGASGCCAWPVRLAIGLGWGTLWGALTGFLGVMLYSAILPKDSLPSATSAGLGQAAVFALLGLGVGAVYGGFSKQAKKAATAAVIGAIAGAAGGILFPMLAGIVMPTQSIVGFVQTSTAGILWLAIPFAAIAYAIPTMSDR